MTARHALVGAALVFLAAFMAGRASVSAAPMPPLPRPVETLAGVPPDASADLYRRTFAREQECMAMLIRGQWKLPSTSRPAPRDADLDTTYRALLARESLIPRTTHEGIR